MNFIDINVLIDRVKRHPMLQDVPMESIIDYAIDFIRIVGTPPAFFDKTAVIEIEDYRGQLPCDFYEMRQVRTMGGAYFRYSSDTFHMSPNKPKTGAVVDGRVVVYADDYDKDKHVEFKDTRHITESVVNCSLTYKLQGACIFTSIPSGEIEIAYLALPMNEEGYPMIPDNSAYIRAMESYIKLQWFSILFDQGKLDPRIYQNAQQQYAWNVGQAQTNLIIPTIDQMEMISNMWCKNLPDTTRDHHTGYINEGTQERMLIH